MLSAQIFIIHIQEVVMWQAIKKFRQAYLDAKGNRLHAEAEASRHALCHSSMSVEEAYKVMNNDDRKSKSAALYLQLCEYDEHHY